MQIGSKADCRCEYANDHNDVLDLIASSCMSGSDDKEESLVSRACVPFAFDFVEPSPTGTLYMYLLSVQTLGEIPAFCPFNPYRESSNPYRLVPSIRTL